MTQDWTSVTQRQHRLHPWPLTHFHNPRPSDVIWTDLSLASQNLLSQHCGVFVCPVGLQRDKDDSRLSAVFGKPRPGLCGVSPVFHASCCSVAVALIPTLLQATNLPESALPTQTWVQILFFGQFRCNAFVLLVSNRADGVVTKVWTRCVHRHLVRLEVISIKQGPAGFLQ